MQHQDPTNLKNLASDHLKDYHRDRNSCVQSAYDI